MDIADFEAPCVHAVLSYCKYAAADRTIDENSPSRTTGRHGSKAVWSMAVRQGAGGVPGGVNWCHLSGWSELELRWLSQECRSGICNLTLWTFIPAFYGRILLGPLDVAGPASLYIHGRKNGIDKRVHGIETCAGLGDLFCGPSSRH